jgi:hypothetical protein
MPSWLARPFFGNPPASLPVAAQQKPLSPLYNFRYSGRSAPE